MGNVEVAAIVNHLLLTKGSFSSGELARAAGISRQAVHRYLRALLAAERLVSKGKGRAARYFSSGTILHRVFQREGLAEHTVWNAVRRTFPQLGEPAVAKAQFLLNYAFTEMLNNAIDHSGSPDVDVSFDLSKGKARFAIVDRGIGVYENVRAHFELKNPLEALQEISKGKVTTKPEEHSGQGIFFTSKVADVFELEGNGLRWTVDNRRDDVAISEVPTMPGTSIRFELSLTTNTDFAEVSARYAQDDHQFDTSRVVVKLFEWGVEFVSRSEAKRILAGLEKFRHVIFDFKGIASVGQGFADEVFSVWAVGHPEVGIETVNMQPTVELMVARSRQPSRDFPDGGGMDVRRLASSDVPGIVITELVRNFDFPLGWTETAIRKVLQDPDALTKLTVPSDPDGSVLVVTRRNVKSSEWAFLGIVVARGDMARTGVASVFVLPRQHVSETLWASPMEALKRFVDVYGREFTVGQSLPKRFFFDETYPLANFDPASSPFVVPHAPDRSYVAIVRARKSNLGAAQVSIGYVIDYTKYTKELAHAGIHSVEFS